jgi:hypothetical protein
LGGRITGGRLLKGENELLMGNCWREDCWSEKNCWRRIAKAKERTWGSASLGAETLREIMLKKS